MYDETDRIIMNESSNKQNVRAKYDDLKLAVKRLEEKNFSRLIVFQSGKDWYKMAGNSLLIYKNEVVPKIKMKANVQPDTDYTNTIFEEGVISFRGEESIRERIEKAKLLKNVTKKSGVIVFDLNLVVSTKQMETYRRELKDDKERAMAILKSNIVLNPETYGKIKYVQKRIFETVRKMSVYERDYNGMVMADYSRKMMEMYMMMNNEMVSEKEGWEEILRLANLLLMEVTFVTELKVVRTDVGVNLGAELTDIRKAAQKAVDRLK